MSTYCLHSEERKSPRERAQSDLREGSRTVRAAQGALVSKVDGVQRWRGERDLIEDPELMKATGGVVCVLYISRAGVTVRMTA